MAIVKITALPAADSPISPSDVAPVVQGGVTKKAAIDQLGYLPSGAGATTRTIQNRLRDTISVKDYGAVGDGVADDTAAIQAAITAANNSAFVFFPSGNYKVIGTLNMPRNVSGNFTITGNIKWSFVKEVIQEGQIYVTGNIELDSVWFSKFNRLECVGNFSIYSTNASWGVFWNDFGTIRCGGTLIIDVDQGQSVNQNNFYSCYCSGGVHIKGTNAVGIREAHNNVFFSIDTTGANLTAADGTAGCHLLNDSNLNQTNTVINWYAELTGGRLAYGNWNILGDNVDATGPVFMGGRYNYRLGARIFGRQASYLPMPIENAALGGNWGILDGAGKPPSITGAGSYGVVALSSISTAATNSPDQSVQGYVCTANVAFSNISISYKLTTSAHVSGAAYVYQEGAPALYIETRDSTGLISAGGGTLTPLGNNWYLLRFGSQGGVIDTASGNLEGTIRIFSSLSTATGASNFRIITSYFITTDAIAPIPSIQYGQTVGYSTAPPSDGTWKRGDICWNTTPSAGGTPGWICVTAGAPGTWKAMANLAA